MQKDRNYSDANFKNSRFKLPRLFKKSSCLENEVNRAISSQQLHCFFPLPLSLSRQLANEMFHLSNEKFALEH